MSAAIFDFEPFRLDLGRRKLLRDGQAVALPRKAFDTLVVLVEEHGQLVAKDELLKRVWHDAFVEENNLNQSISALRRGLGDSAGEPRYIETIPGRGYRFIAAIEAPLTAASAPRSLAVLPLRTLSADPDEWLGIGIADTLIARLSNVAELVVRPTSAVLPYAKQEGTPAEAGRALDVDAVLEGSIRRAGDRIRVTVQLVSVDREAPIWAGTFDERFTDIFAVEDSISQRVAEALTTRLTAEERSLLTHRETENSDVYRLYLNGRWYANRLTHEGSAKAVECLRQAVELEPAYALGHAGLAYHYLQCADLILPSREAMTLAEEAALMALAIDEKQIDARVSLAAVRWFHDWDADASRREFERALEADRRNANTLHLYGWCLVLMGRGDEGVAALRRAETIDPYSHENVLYNSPGLYFARRFDEALPVTRDAIERDPDLWLAWAMLGRIHEVRGDLDAAIEAYRRSRALAGTIVEVLGDLGRALGLAGRTAEAQAVLDELHARARTEHIPAFILANVHLGLGEIDQALNAITAAIEERSWYVTWLHVAPMLDELRGDRRWREVVERVRPM
jgi:serine/threonine-protein kinase